MVNVKKKIVQTLIAHSIKGVNSILRSKYGGHHSARNFAKRNFSPFSSLTINAFQTETTANRRGRESRGGAKGGFRLKKVGKRQSRRVQRRPTTFVKNNVESFPTGSRGGAPRGGGM